MNDLNNNIDRKTSQSTEPIPGVKLKVFRPEDKRQLWSPNFEVIFILRGTGRISYSDGVLYNIKKNDILAVNGFDICSVDLAENGLLLSMKISPEVIVSLHPELLHYQIRCASFLADENQQEKFDIVRTDFAKVFREMYKNTMNQGSYPKSKITALLEDLTKYFKGDEKVELSKSGRDRIQMASDYILSHYKEEITLESLAKHIYLSETYISRTFPKYFGVSFLEYVTQVRLAHAVEDMHTSLSLTEIAYNNGFTNENMMIRAFKKYRGMTPGEYRKSIEKPESKAEMNPFPISPDLLPINDDFFESILKYADGNESETEVKSERNIYLEANFSARKQKIAGHFRRVINAGYARDVLDERIQIELRYQKKLVGYEYVRVKGILDDDMFVLRNDIKGTPRLNFSYVEEVIDYILSIGAKPMIEVGSMPSLLARDEGQMKTLRPIRHSLPTDFDKWQSLIHELMHHLLARYGKNQMRSWIFMPWITTDYVDTFSWEDFMRTYKASYDEIKAVLPEVLTAMPFSLSYEKKVEPYFKKCVEYDCMPEILAVRAFSTTYGDKADGLNLIENIDSYDFGVTRDVNYLANQLKSVKAQLKEIGLENMPIIVDEFSNNVWQRDLTNDTIFKSCWYMKNILENEDNCNGIGVFTLNDRIDEVFPVNKPFHGGFGMYTPSGIPKAIVSASVLVGKMGNYLIKKGDGYYIAYDSDTETYQIYLYNYAHYDTLYRYRHTVNISDCDRYRVFENDIDNNITIRLTGLREGFIKKRSYKISKEHGSSYDAWVKMGAPEILSSEEREMLIHSVYPDYHTERLTSDGVSALILHERLQAHEVMLIEMKYEES